MPQVGVLARCRAPHLGTLIVLHYTGPVDGGEWSQLLTVSGTIPTVAKEHGLHAHPILI